MGEREQSINPARSQSAARLEFLTVDFTLSDDQRAIQDMARSFAQSEMAPHSARWDEEKYFPVEVMRQAAGRIRA